MSRNPRKTTLSPSMFSEIVGDIYDAALDPRFWPRFLDHTRVVLRADMATMIAGEYEQPERGMFLSANIDPATLSEIQHRSNEDAWHRARYLGEGTYFGREIVPQTELHETPFYSEVVRPAGIEFACISMVEHNRSRYTLFALFRGRRLPDFDEADKQFMQIIGPHVRRATLLNRRIAESIDQSAAFLEALDKSPYGIVMLDSRGRVIALNRTAESIAQQVDGIRIHCHELLLSRSSEQRELERLISSSVDTALPRADAPAGAIAVSRPSGRLPYQIAVSPLRSRYPELLAEGRATAICFIHDPLTSRAPGEQLLRTFYRLTPAEARLACKLVSSGTLSHAADALQISINTAKTQLKTVFSKTGAANQSELVRLLMKGITEPVADVEPAARDDRHNRSHPDL